MARGLATLCCAAVTTVTPDLGLAQDYSVSTTEAPDPLPVEEASSQVSREELQLRLPRSAPDALRYEPGVFVQQTAHGQGSAYIRGMTGQQTVTQFDDIRMNNSLYRQGPNQYFFTVDSLTLDRIEVTRGSASTRYGSDALGGVIRAYSVLPAFDDALHARLVSRFATADRTRGARAEISYATGNVAMTAGSGFRLVDELESGGPVYNPRDGKLPEVPRFRRDGRTQVGTGFDEVASDVRVRWQATADDEVRAGFFDYRQFDVPRTDNCPPPFAPWDECLKYEEQFRHLAYIRWDGRLGPAARDAHVVVSWQRQHERRRQVRPFALADEVGRDDVDTLGLSAKATTPTLKGPWVNFHAVWGADAYADWVDSRGWTVFRTLDLVRERSRGQYIDGSTYLWGGAFVDGVAHLFGRGVLTLGGRASHIAASSPGDAASGTQSIDQSWSPLVGHLAAEWWASPWLTVAANVDQGFRAPNLDDLTSRQRTGPGYQFENPDLRPEASWTTEVGAILRKPPLQFDMWVFRTTLEDAIARQPRNTQACPPATPACNGSWSRFRLVNLAGEAELVGVEAAARWEVGPAVLRATLAYARGEGPSPEEGREHERVPLSRVPPLNGTAEATWRFDSGAHLGASMRWATAQDRLALQDMSDARIPVGGTPAYAVADVRTGYRLDDRMAMNLVFENIWDEAYRSHGSSINGPGRGLYWQIELGF